MTRLECQIRMTQRRLWLNRWFQQVSRLVAGGAALFAVVVLVQRLYAFPLPLFWIGAGVSGAVLLTSLIWTAATREDAAVAAARLDEAAGLKERISTGHYCQGSTDPFSLAVRVDAERVSSSLSVRQHIRLEAPVALLYGTGSIMVAALTFLITPGLLHRTETEGSETRSLQAEEAKVAVKRTQEQLRSLAEQSPALDDMKADIEGLDRFAGAAPRTASQIRHEAVKRIDKVADAVNQKRRSPEYDAVSEMRKMMRGLKVPASSDAPTQKLANALAQGDFKTAREEINALKEQLATLKSEKDEEMVVKLSQHLENLSRQLEQLAQDQQLTQKLQQAGIKKEDLDRLPERLSKRDLDQLEKQLAEKGFSRQQIDKISEELQRKQQAGSIARGLSNAMRQASQCKSCGQIGNAVAGLSQAADQLSALETLEQDMSQLDTTLAALRDAQTGLDMPCSACGGTGMLNGKPCPHCRGGDGSGRCGMGPRLGQGRGGLAPEQQTGVGFKTERGKVPTGRGAIIGQIQFDGEQVKGEVTSSLVEVMTAAERDATDRINRDRVPRQYQKAIKAYFSNVQRSVGDTRATQAGDGSAATSDEGTAGESSKQAKDEGTKD